MKTADPNVFVQINDLLCRFFLSFDNRDWPAMVECLAPQIVVDYSSSGREQPTTMSGQDFVSRRQNAVDRLAKHHSFSNLLITHGLDGHSAAARCNYLILRFAPTGSDEDFFHSCGNYEFGFGHVEGGWKIASIKQNALRSWGKRSLHGGSAQGKA